MTRRPSARRRPRLQRAGRVFRQLIAIMETLRSARGCPWDRRQTPRSLRPFLLEETYEALDAIDRGDHEDLRGELGDVLFQCVFQAQLAAEAGRFDIADSVQSIVDKLIRRHPHVFTKTGRRLPVHTARTGRVRTAPAVLQQWEQIKAREQQAADRRPRVLAGVPRALPSLARAHEISTRVAAVGFDWSRPDDVLAKIEEEARELKAALRESPQRAAEELGDLLFTVANLGRKLGLDPESALREANDKFTRRFAGVEDLLETRGRNVHVASLEEMEAAWTTVKTEAARRAARTVGPRTRSRSAPSRSALAPSRRPSPPKSRRRGRS